MSNMTVKEFFVYCVEGEKAGFIRVLDTLTVLPRKNLDYRPDPKSKSGFELAHMFANEFAMIEKFLNTGKWNMKEEAHVSYNNIDEIKSEATRAIDAVTAKAKRMSEEDWESEGEAWEKMKKSEFAFDMLFDLVHHRGQISTYIRSMGGKNPSIYGPSADVTMADLMKQS